MQEARNGDSQISSLHLRPHPGTTQVARGKMVYKYTRGTKVDIHIIPHHHQSRLEAGEGQPSSDKPISTTIRLSLAQLSLTACWDQFQFPIPKATPHPTNTRLSPFPQPSPRHAAAGAAAAQPSEASSWSAGAAALQALVGGVTALFSWRR